MSSSRARHSPPFALVPPMGQDINPPPPEISLTGALDDFGPNSPQNVTSSDHLSYRQSCGNVSSRRTRDPIAAVPRNTSLPLSADSSPSDSRAARTTHKSRDIVKSPPVEEGGPANEHHAPSVLSNSTPEEPAELWVAWLMGSYPLASYTRLAKGAKDCLLGCFVSQPLTPVGGPIELPPLPPPKNAGETQPPPTQNVWAEADINEAPPPSY